VQAQGMKKYDEAEAFWKEVIEIDPAGQLAPLNLTHIWAERKDWETALSWATKAFVLSPENKDVQQNLGLCAFHTGDYIVAEKMAKSLLSKEPMNPLGRGLLGAIEELKKKPKEV
jgi:tetratricopeptide (TPR) repeat protein